LLGQCTGNWGEKQSSVSQELKTQARKGEKENLVKGKGHPEGSKASYKRYWVGTKEEDACVRAISNGWGEGVNMERNWSKFYR